MAPQHLGLIYCRNSLRSVCNSAEVSPIMWNQCVLCLCHCVFPLFIQAVKSLFISLKRTTLFARKAAMNWSMWPMFLSHPSCERWVIRINNMALIRLNPATELRRREKERQKEEEEEEGECTLREVRPRFRDPRPHTPQVLWHCLYERARRTQTHRISVWLSMSPGAEPIGRDKAGLIALSSASQREGFSTWTTACAPRCTSHLSATLDPRDICLLFFVHLCPPLPFFLSGPRRLSTVAQQQDPPPPHFLPPPWKQSTSTGRFLFLPVVMCSARCASSSLATKSCERICCLSSFPLWLWLASCISAQPACRHIRQKAQSPAVRP